ncbi:unnamed protein product [Ceratitis capitata]|uniref:(Mediterranean fruit fly) hypothetical protein n=1 Tax=Ceratitis capitata TaxID=7213 RepID=A0A811U708_CERCA|nr:unnamed protein product [Ceratitis capitata]
MFVHIQKSRSKQTHKISGAPSPSNISSTSTSNDAITSFICHTFSCAFLALASFAHSMTGSYGCVAA